ADPFAQLAQLGHLLGIERRARLGTAADRVLPVAGIVALLGLDQVPRPIASERPLAAARLPPLQRMRPNERLLQRVDILGHLDRAPFHPERSGNDYFGRNGRDRVYHFSPPINYLLLPDC